MATRGAETSKKKIIKKRPLRSALSTHASFQERGARNLINVVSLATRTGPRISHCY